MSRLRSFRARLDALPRFDRLRLYAWLGVVVVLAVFGVGVQGRLHSTNPVVPGNEATRASDLAKKEFGRAEQELIVLHGPPSRLRDEASFVSRRVSALPHTSVLDPWTAGSRAL